MDSLQIQKGRDTFNTQGIPIDTLGTIKPIQRIQEFPLSPFELALWIIMGIGIISLAFIILKKILSKKNRVLPINSPKDPHQWAADKIREIQKNTRDKKLTEKEYFVQVSAILREFIFWVNKVDAPRYTTTEVIQVLTRIQNYGPERQKILKELLGIADKVKFSGSIPNALLVEEYGKLALDFVKKPSQIL